MKIVDDFLKLILKSSILVSKKQIGPHTFHLKLQSDYFKTMAYIPGQHLRMFVGNGQPVSMGDMIRTYSIWNLDRENSCIDLAVCTFSNGPGVEWVKKINEGDTVYLKGPEGKFTADFSGDFYFFVGDISALAHLYELRRSLEGKKIFSVLYGADEKDFFSDFDGSQPFLFHNFNESPFEDLIEKIKSFAVPSGKGIAYIAGDGRVCIFLNKYFRSNLNWNSKQIKTKPFWMPDKKGLE